MVLLYSSIYFDECFIGSSFLAWSVDYNTECLPDLAPSYVWHAKAVQADSNC